MAPMGQLPRVAPLVTPLLLWLALPGGGDLWPALFVALVPMLWGAQAITAKRALALGFACGLLFHALQLYWLVNVLTQFGGLPLVLAVPALFLLVAYMAAYFAAKVAAASLLLRCGSPLLGLLAIPAVWVGLDWLRSLAFSGFPWMDLGYGLAGVPELIQSAELFGHGVLTYLVVLVNTCFALSLRAAVGCRLAVAPLIVTLAVTAPLVLYSFLQFAQQERELALLDGRKLRVGIVQGNIDQSLKWSADMQRQTVETYLEATAELSAQQAELVVWPETALPLYPTNYEGMGEVFARIGGAGVAVLTGSPWYEIVDIELRQIRYYNSAQLLLPDGTFGPSYYKSHLVPFGEYVPLKRFLPFISPLVEAVGDFSAGTVETPLDFKDARVGVLICFESIFPAIARHWVEEGANVLVNLTNDAWYGKSSAPYHSMAMTVFRAVETRRWLIRAANTGISGFVDPAGRLVQPSEIFTDWAGTAEIQLLEGKTHFVRWGYLFAPLCALLGLAALFSTWKTSQNRP